MVSLTVCSSKLLFLSIIKFVFGCLKYGLHCNRQLGALKPGQQSELLFRYLIISGSYRRTGMERLIGCDMKTGSGWWHMETVNHFFIGDCERDTTRY